MGTLYKIIFRFQKYHETRKQKPMFRLLNVQEEERVRKNRLALLKKISDLPSGIADLSILPGF